jgi:hypothetical protein
MSLYPLSDCFPAEIFAQVFSRSNVGTPSHRASSPRPIFLHGWAPLSSLHVNYHVRCLVTCCYFYASWGTWNNRYPNMDVMSAHVHKDDHNAQKMIIMEIIEHWTPRVFTYMGIRDTGGSWHKNNMDVILPDAVNTSLPSFSMLFSIFLLIF